MYSVRFHGRGGQGVVTAAEMLAVAAFVEDRHAQAFPSFGSERMGAPVVSYCRIDDRPIRRHDPLDRVDAVVVGDPTLLHETDLLTGLVPDGRLLVNTTRTAEHLPASLAGSWRGDPGLVTVPATEVAQRTIGRPLPNTALLGALAAVTGVVSLDALCEAISRRFAGSVAEANVAAAREAAGAVVGRIPATPGTDRSGAPPD